MRCLQMNTSLTRVGLKYDLAHCLRSTTLYGVLECEGEDMDMFEFLRKSRATVQETLKDALVSDLITVIWEYL